GVRRAAAAGSWMALVALAAMVAVAAAATLWSGAGVVRTLRLIGAEDRFISRAFERPFALRAAFGAAVGAAAAAIFALTMPRIGTEMFSTGAFGAEPLLWLAPLAPPVAALIAGLTALGATRAAAYLVLRRG
ncbi:MAG: cell division protein FtsX, partial [Paracoccaceae bacterium]